MDWRLPAAAGAAAVLKRDAAHLMGTDGVHDGRERMSARPSMARG